MTSPQTQQLQVHNIIVHNSSAEWKSIFEKQ